MSKFTLVLLLIVIPLVAWLDNSRTSYKQKYEESNELANELELKYEALLKETGVLAELYLRVGDHVRNARFSTLQETLRLDEAVLNSEPDSDLYNWSKSELPKEVKDVMSNVGKGGSYATEVGE